MKAGKLTYIKQIASLESATKALQKNNISVSDPLALFDAVTKKFPDTVDRLSSSAGIIDLIKFESGIVKIHRGNGVAMSN